MHQYFYHWRFYYFFLAIRTICSTYSWLLLYIFSIPLTNLLMSSHISSKLLYLCDLYDPKSRVTSHNFVANVHVVNMCSIVLSSCRHMMHMLGPNHPPFVGYLNLELLSYLQAIWTFALCMRFSVSIVHFLTYMTVLSCPVFDSLFWQRTYDSYPIAIIVQPCYC